MYPREMHGGAAVIGAVVIASALLVLWWLVRLVSEEAASTTLAVTSSPWNDVEALPTCRARVGEVVAVDGEMLVELHFADAESPTGDDTMWLIGPTSPASIVTLSRWRDAGAAVTVACALGRVLLQTRLARVNLRATPDPDVTGEVDRPLS